MRAGGSATRRCSCRWSTRPGRCLLCGGLSGGDDGSLLRWPRSGVRIFWRRTEVDLVRQHHSVSGGGGALSRGLAGERSGLPFPNRKTPRTANRFPTSFRSECIYRCRTVHEFGENLQVLDRNVRWDAFDPFGLSGSPRMHLPAVWAERLHDRFIKQSPRAMGGHALTARWRSRRWPRTSRSSTLIRSRSSVVRPARWPTSRSAWRTQLRSVSAVQPILPAIDMIVAHCEPCSVW